VFVWARNKKSAANQSFALACLTTFCWQISWALLFSHQTHQFALPLVKIGYSFIIFIPPTLYHFFADYLKASQERKFVIAAYLFSGVMLFFLWASPLFIVHYYSFYWGFYPKAGPLHWIYLLALSVQVIRVYFLLQKDLKTTRSPRRKNQSRYLIAALVAYTFAASDFLVNYGIEFYPIGFIAILVTLGLIAYAIARFHLLDIELVIKRTLVFTGLFGVIIGVVTGVTTIAQSIVGRYFGFSEIVVRILSVLVAMALFSPVRKFLVKITDRYLFQKKEDVRVILNRLSQNIITILDIAKAGTTILETLKDSLRLESGVILIQSEDGKTYEIMDSFGIQKGYEQFPKDGLFIRHFLEADRVLNLEDSEQKESIPSVIRGPLELLGAVICIPLFIHHELIGLLMLGKKKSDQDFSEEEIDCFPAVAGQVAIALSNARLYHVLLKSQIDFAQQAKMAAIGTLSAGISHEIKNPLNHIRVGIGMLKLNKKHGVYANFNKEQFEEEVFKTLEIFEQNVVRANSVIERLSGFAKKPKELKIEAVDLRQAVETGLKFLEDEFRNYDIQIEKNFPEFLPLIQADRHTLEDVFLNLLVNARHAMDRKGKITITGHVQGKELFMDIQDAGKGIPRENLDKIFDPFFTTKDVSRNPDKEAIKGSGLGLFIVREFVQRFGGHILLESEVGKGTTFHIVFPASTWVEAGGAANG
jgi:signal transduction histidine kinase